MMTRVIELLPMVVARFQREDGQGLAEYGLIIAFVAVALVGALTTLALGIIGGYDNVIAAFP